MFTYLPVLACQQMAQLLQACDLPAITCSAWTIWTIPQLDSDVVKNDMDDEYLRAGTCLLQLWCKEGLNVLEHIFTSRPGSPS